MSTSIPMGTARFAVGGAGFACGMSGLATLIQSRASAEPRGRIMALWLIGCVGSRPLAAAILGPTADVFGVRAAFAVATAVTALFALVCLPRRIHPNASHDTARVCEQPLAMPDELPAALPAELPSALAESEGAGVAQRPDVDQPYQDDQQPRPRVAD